MSPTNASNAGAGAEAGYRDLSIPYPALFWACRADDGLKMATNPVDRVNIGYDGLFGPKPLFYHVPPVAAGNGEEGRNGGVGELMAGVRVPVLDQGRAGWVEGVTAVAVLAGCAWVGWKVWGVWSGNGQRVGEREEEKKVR